MIYYLIIITIIGWYYLICLVTNYGRNLQQNELDMKIINNNFRSIVKLMEDHKKIYEEDRVNIFMHLRILYEEYINDQRIKNKLIPWEEFQKKIFANDIDWDEEIKKLDDNGELK